VAVVVMLEEEKKLFAVDNFEIDLMMVVVVVAENIELFVFVSINLNLFVVDLNYLLRVNRYY
jgi:hypothetical protein